jgi:CHAT domain
MPATELSTPVVREALGGSVIYEEYRGDLAQARTLADEAVAAGRSSDAADGLAEGLVARAVVLVLQGNLRDARADLIEIEGLGVVDRDVLLRAESYRMLAAYLDANCFPNVMGAGGAEPEARQAAFLAEVAEITERRTAVMPGAGPEVQLEAERTGGDDVVGLARGLIAAGARAVVVSLWPVGDLSTSLLMARFYARLREGDPPAVAFAKAQDYLRGLSPEEAQGELERLQEAVTGKANEIALADDLERDVTRRTPRRSTDYRHPRHCGAMIAIG